MNKAGWVVLGLVIAIVAIIAISNLQAQNEYRPVGVDNPNLRGDLNRNLDLNRNDLEEAGEDFKNDVKEAGRDTQNAFQNAGDRIKDKLD